ncbi:hypothetical protein CHU98_g4173 [Xylaria longipes]|nr:hypothetical protein CHU98_g4173 [Xylaria longipes]
MSYATALYSIQLGSLLRLIKHLDEESGNPTTAAQYVQRNVLRLGPHIGHPDRSSPTSERSTIRPFGCRTGPREMTERLCHGPTKAAGADGKSKAAVLSDRKPVEMDRRLLPLFRGDRLRQAHPNGQSRETQNDGVSLGGNAAFAFYMAGDTASWRTSAREAAGISYLGCYGSEYGRTSVIMKAYFSLLALATSAIAGGYGGYGYPPPPPYYSSSIPDVTTTEYATTYTTVTTCPAYTTVTSGGSTYVDTILTTSTIVVTEGGGEVTVTGPDTTVGTTTQVEVTYTTTCPVTETTTVGGSTYTHVYTTTSVEVTYVDTTIYATSISPPVTETTGEVVYTTQTSLCPVTETKTIGGETVVVTWTSTSTIVTEVPTTAVEYTSYTVTEHVETSVYETVTCPETTYATVSEGSTIYVTNTDTFTNYITTEYTVIETIPVTATTEVDVTVTSEATGAETVTAQPTVWVTYSSTAVISQPAPTTTVVYPTTISTVISYSSSAPASSYPVPPVSSSSSYSAVPTASSSASYSAVPTVSSSSISAPTTTPSAVPTGLAPRVTPVAALLFGVAGIAALL